MKKSLYTLSLVAIILLGCDGDETRTASGRLDYYTESYDLAGSGLDFTPMYKVTYQYDHDDLIRFTFFGYNPESKAFEKQRYFDLSYVDGRVGKLTGFLAGETSRYVEYSYQYLPDLRLSKIAEDNDGIGITSEANFSYNDEEQTVKVAYTYSNGGSFEYEFNFATYNILNDKTTRGTQLCSDGTYTYDDHKNPFRELGYVDYTLTNISANNKLSEDVNYVGCGFPTLVPVSYSYEYNNIGYPTKATTLYSSGATSVKQFYYR